MNKIYILFLCLCYAVSAIMANTYKNDKEVTSPTDANIFGHVVDKATGEHLPGITIILKGTTIGSVTDDSGHYMLKNLPEGEFTIEVSFVGFKTVTKKVTTGKGKTQELNFELEEDLISLEGVVVSANRNETKRRLAPTLVKVLSPTVFEKTNSTTLAQGLVFQPGVRVENDCQNCGYSQVRINGMEGKYTQILIDSRPIFSALAGVYGLEQIPANMIERVEVIRGGGSALFGSSAIAGTINIITKEPIRNSGSFGHTISNLDGSGAYDNNTTLNLSWVSSDNKMGAYIYGQNRYRSAWDSNGDGFSELPKLKNQTIGFNALLEAKAQGRTGENRLFFCEHQPVLTIGKSGKDTNLLIPEEQLVQRGISFYHINRGGDITYHGPGQITGYPVFDLDTWKLGLKQYIDRLEETIIRFLAIYGIKGERLAGATGVWIDPGVPRKARKICAIGVKSSRFVTMHGFALNINTDLDYFSLINPCGFKDKGVTSLEKEMGMEQDFEEAKARLHSLFTEMFPE